MAYLGERLPILDEVAKLQDYDLVLFLEADVKWVDDGTRTFGDQSARDGLGEQLKLSMDEHNVKYISISGNYQQRLEKAVHLVNELIGMEGL